MLISRPDPADDQAEADEDSAVSTSLAAAPEEDPARTSFILSHPSLSLSRKVQFSAPPSYHALLGRVLLILAPSHFKPSQLCFSYIDAQLKRHLVKDQTDLEKLYDDVGKGEDIRLKLVVREGGRMGLKECDKALRKLFVSKSVISEAVAPLPRKPAPVTPTQPSPNSAPRSRRSSTPESSVLATPEATYPSLPPRPVWASTSAPASGPSAPAPPPPQLGEVVVKRSARTGVLVDEVRILIRDLQQSLVRLDALHEQAVGTSVDPGPSSPPSAPLQAAMPRPSPPLLHPVPYHPIPRPTFHAPPSVDTSTHRPLPRFAPDLSTPPRIASPTDDDDDGSVEIEQDAWAYLPTALDLDLNGTMSRKTTSGSPLPPFVFGPQDVDWSQATTDTLYATTVKANPPQPSITLLQSEQAGPSVDATPDSGQRSDSSEDDESSDEDVTLWSNKVSKEAKNVSSPEVSDLKVRPSSDSSKSHSSDTNSGELSIAPITVSPSSGSSSRPKPKQKPAIASTATSPVVRSPSFSTSYPIDYHSPNAFDFARADHAQSQRQMIQPAHPQQFRPQQHPWIVSNGYGGTPSNFVVGVPCVPAMVFPGMTMGWSPGSPGMSMVTVNGTPGVLQGVNGYPVGVHTPKGLQPDLAKREWLEQSPDGGAGSSIPRIPNHPQYLYHNAFPSPSTASNRPVVDKAFIAQPRTIRNPHPFASQHTSVFKPAPAPRPVEIKNPPVPSTTHLPVPHVRLPPPPAAGQKSPPPMPAHLLPIYLKVYRRSFPDVDKRLKVAEEKAAAAKKEKEEKDKGGWIESGSSDAHESNSDV